MKFLESFEFSLLRFENRLVFHKLEFVRNVTRNTFKGKDSEFE